MQLFKKYRTPYIALVALVAIGITGCIQLLPITERTLILEPENTASIFGTKQYETFGICWPFSLDRRGTQLYLWDEFLRQLESPHFEHPVQSFAGYEVGVSRGESCHLRILDTYQAAVKFDLSDVPDNAALVSAELRVDKFFSPHDPPVLRGSDEQCTILLLGEATELWAPGIYGPGEGTYGIRPFISWIPARIDTGPHTTRHIGTLSMNVSRTVSAWLRGVRENEGFVITPDEERVLEIYRNTDESGFMCDMGITGFELELTIAVPE